MQDYYDKPQPRQPYTGISDNMQSGMPDGMPAGFTGAMPVGMPGTYPYGMPYMMPGGSSWQSFDAQQDPPRDPPPGMPPFAQPPGGFAQGPGSPPGPPPAFVPSHAIEQQSAGVLSINPGAIRPCIFRYVYLWLNNGQNFWAWLVFVGSRSVAGWRWTGFRWIYFGIDTRRISSFACF